LVLLLLLLTASLRTSPGLLLGAHRKTVPESGRRTGTCQRRLTLLVVAAWMEQGDPLPAASSLKPLLLLLLLQVQLLLVLVLLVLLLVLVLLLLLQMTSPVVRGQLQW
jgi:hypothetical protein